MTILLAIVMPGMGRVYVGFPDGTKHFVSETGAASIGVTLFLLKKKIDQKIRNLTPDEKDEKTKLEESSLTAEIFEILMFLIMPGLALFGVFSNEIKVFPMLIIVIFGSLVTLWFIIATIQITRRYGIGEGRIVSSFVNRFFAFMLVMATGYTILIFYLESLPRFDS